MENGFLTGYTLGMRLSFPPGFDYVKQDFEKYGYWEKRTTEYITHHLNPGHVFLDVGANVGYFTILAAELGAKVIAVEPSTENRTMLQTNITDNNCTVQIIPHALSNATGTLKLYTGKTPGEHSLKANYHNLEGFELVNVVRYDDLNLPVPDMLKLDIEGNEREALEGMSSVLTTDKPITLILEDWDNSTTDWLTSEYGWHLVTTDRGSGNRILTKNQPYEYTEEPITCHLLGTFNAPVTLKHEMMVRLVLYCSTR